MWPCVLNLGGCVDIVSAFTRTRPSGPSCINSGDTENVPEPRRVSLCLLLPAWFGLRAHNSRAERQRSEEREGFVQAWCCGVAGAGSAFLSPAGEDKRTKQGNGTIAHAHLCGLVCGRKRDGFFRRRSY